MKEDEHPLEHVASGTNIIHLPSHAKKPDLVAAPTPARSGLFIQALFRHNIGGRVRWRCILRGLHYDATEFFGAGVIS
jgi:hypothetical protein